MRRHAPALVSLTLVALALALLLWRTCCRPSSSPSDTQPLPWRVYLAHHSRTQSATVLVSACLHPGHFPPLSTPELQSRYQAIQLAPADGPGPVALVYLDRQAPHAQELLSLLEDRREHRLILTLAPHPRLPDVLLVTSYLLP